MKIDGSYSYILDHMFEGCQVITPDWKYLYLNDSAEEHSGLPKEKLLGHTMMEVYPGISGTSMFKKLQDCMEKRTYGKMANEFIYPDGSKKIFELRFEPVPEGILIFSLDITERERTEAALELSEKRLRKIFESAIEGIAIADIEKTCFLFVNPAFCRMFGYTEKELLTMEIKDLHPPEDFHRVLEQFKLQAEGKIILARNTPCQKKDGKIFYSDINTVRIIFNGRDCNLGFFRDVTEQKKRSEELEQHVKELEIFYDSAVNREERIIELKEKVRELKRQLEDEKSG
jgi:PAS domain S-box-containing protein